MAIADINARQFGVSYLCTSTTLEWKHVLEMISLILGNNAALFGVAFAIMITAAQWYEARQERRERPWPTGSSTRDFQPLRDLEYSDGYTDRQHAPMMSAVDSSRHHPASLRPSASPHGSYSSGGRSSSTSSTFTRDLASPHSYTY